MVVKPLATVRPSAPAPALLPSITTSGVPENPVSVEPSIVTLAVIAGNGDRGSIVCGPVPGRSNVIVDPGLPLALRIACRSDPGPLSAVLVTVYGSPKPGAPGSTMVPFSV